MSKKTLGSSTCEIDFAERHFIEFLDSQDGHSRIVFDAEEFRQVEAQLTIRGLTAVA